MADENQNQDTFDTTEGIFSAFKKSAEQQEQPKPEPSVITGEVSSGVPTTQQEWKAAKDLASYVKEEAKKLPESEIAPRQVAYGAGAALGLKYPKLFDPLSWTEASIRQQQRKLAAAAAQEQLNLMQAAKEGTVPPQVRGQPIARTGTGEEAWLHKMSGERVPEALSREVQGMGRGPQGATTISEQNARLAAKAREIAPGYVLQGENVPAEPPRSFQLLAKPGTIPTAPAPAVVQPSTLETAAQMAKKITQPVSTFLNIPVVKGALHGANILGTGLQALEDIYHKDPLGLAITAGQAASGLLGPGGALIGIPLGEGVRYLRKHLSEQTPKQADLAQFGIEPLSKYGLQQMYEINMP